MTMRIQWVSTIYKILLSSVLNGVFSYSHLQRFWESPRHVGYLFKQETMWCEYFPSFKPAVWQPRCQVLSPTSLSLSLRKDG